MFACIICKINHIWCWYLVIRIMNSISFGKYNRFIKRAVSDMQIETSDHILDLGCGTGKNAALMAEYLGAEGKITGIDLSPVMDK